MCERLLEATGNPTVAKIGDFGVGKPLSILFILLGALVVNALARRGIERGVKRLHAGGLQERLGAARSRVVDQTAQRSARAAQRLEALSTVLTSVASFVVWTTAAFLVLAELGVALGPLLAGAGIIGVALGFGSQKLVEDFLSGLFILAEDQFGVGDIVDVGGAVGEVEAVSLRTTSLRSLEGTLWHVPNGEIRRVGNMSQHWARALLDVEVAYGTDIARAREVIKQVADEVWREDPAVIEEPEIWGVERLGQHGVAIRFVVKTKPSEQWPVSRKLRERIKEALDREGIEIPFPQQTVWLGDRDGAGAPRGAPRSGEPAGG